MRFLLFTEGVVGMIAAIFSYLWGYLDGRAEIRNMREKMFCELRNFE